MVAAIRVEGDASSSEEEEPERKQKIMKMKKEQVQEEVAVLNKQPSVPVQTITSSALPVIPMNTAPTPPLSNATVYGSRGGEQRRGRGKYDKGRNYASPAEMGARRNEENGWFVGACYVCEETGHRAN